MEINAKYENSIKLLLLGDSCVGKSNFIFRFFNNKFKGQHLSSAGIELKNSVLTINNKKLHLQIWDTAGQEKYKTVTKSLFSKVQGFIVMFDLTKLQTFENVKKWIKLIKEECGNYAPILLVGNKNDIKHLRNISEVEIKKLTKEEELDYIETSSKTGENVRKAINMICSDITDKNTLTNHFSFSLDSSKSSKSRRKKAQSSCC